MSSSFLDKTQGKAAARSAKRSARPYFDPESARLVCPDDWNGDREGLGDITLALLDGAQIEREEQPSIADRLDADAEKWGCVAPESLNSSVSDFRGQNRPRPLADFLRPPAGDRSELLKNRFLCRDGGGLIVGPTGIGKSSFIVQVALCWSVGKSALGLEPNGSLRILLIQAENDDGDVAEMRDGVIEGLRASGEFTEAECKVAAVSVKAVHVTTVVGDDIGTLLEEIAPGFDLVILDPAFAYIGADAMQAREVSHFLREVITPVIKKLGMGMLIVHHTNKPLRGVEKVSWQAGDFAYLGAGAAEWTNWARCVIAIRSIGHESVFELRAAKRGKRLGWEDHDGNRTVTKFIGHSEHGICWREVPQDEADAVRAAMGERESPAKVSLSEHVRQARRLFSAKACWTKCDLKQAITNIPGISPSRYDRDVLPALKEDSDTVEATVRRGKTPVHLIGSQQEAVEAEEARIEREYAESRQREMGLE